MDQIYRGPLPGGGFVIACGRRRRVKCTACKTDNAQLECDGCDKPLCMKCSVSPRKELDFCPRCFDPAWKHWLKESAVIAGHREQRRAEFRAWARANAARFLELVPLGQVTRDAIYSAMVSCPRCAPGLGAAPELCTGHPLHQLKEK